MQTKLMCQLDLQDAFEELWRKVRAELIEDGYTEDEAEAEAVYLAREAALDSVESEAAVYY